MLLAISVIIFLWHAAATSAQCNQLVTITECVCPGQTVVYRCSVMGGIFTVYDGTAFECGLREISLSNNAFGTANNPMQRCNGQQISITGLGLSSMNDCFTSQINVTLGDSVILGDSGGSGRTISCGVDDGSGTVMPVGTTTLNISTVGLAPPIVSLTAASPSYVTFSWNPVSSNCPSLHYNITSRNCGICPNRADITSINCTDFSEALSRDGALECVLSVQTVICGETSASVGGNFASTSVALKVPSPPNLSIIPYYFEDDRLKGFDASITLTDPIPVQISDSFNASAKSIHFTFVNENNKICRDETEIQVSNSCVGVVCSHYSSETCSTYTETGIIVHASNILGNGMMSSKRIISNMNGFVRIRFVLSLTTNPRTGTVECIFKDPRDGRKTCEIVIKRGDMFVNKTDQTPSDSDNIVRINVDDLLVNEGMNEVNELSYTITASDDTGRVVVVQDVHSLISSPTVNTEGIAGGTVGAIVAVVIFVVFAAAVIVLLILRQPWRQVEKKGLGVETREYEAHADPDSGMLYRKTKPNEFLPPIDGKLIAQHDKTKRSFGLDSADLARLFVDDHRQVRQVRKYSLCIQTFGRPGPDATNYLICERNPAKNNLLSQITPEPQLPEGVQRLDHWFKIIEVQNGDQLSSVCATNKLIVFTEQDNCRLFYSDIRRTLPQQGELNRLRVLAVDYNEHLYEDKDKNLARDLLAGKELKKWKSIFFQAIKDADRNMTKGSMVLFYDPSLELVSKPFERYKTSSDCEETILRFITNKTGNDQCTLDDKNIYRQWDREIQDGREIPADLKLVALSENNRLYNIASRDSILGHLNEGRCTHVFVLVQEDELALPDTLFLYIPSQ